MSKTWERQQAERIMRDAEQDYGRGWARISDAQKQDYIQARVLMLILTQAGEQFAPAQDLARRVLSATQALIDGPSP